MLFCPFSHEESMPRVVNHLFSKTYLNRWLNEAWKTTKPGLLYPLLPLSHSTVLKYFPKLLSTEMPPPHSILFIPRAYLLSNDFLLHCEQQACFPPMGQQLRGQGPPRHRRLGRTCPKALMAFLSWLWLLVLFCLCFCFANWGLSFSKRGGETSKWPIGRKKTATEKRGISNDSDPAPQEEWRLRLTFVFSRWKECTSCVLFHDKAKSLFSPCLGKAQPLSCQLLSTGALALTAMNHPKEDIRKPRGKAVFKSRASVYKFNLFTYLFVPQLLCLGIHIRRKFPMRKKYIYFESQGQIGNDADLNSRHWQGVKLFFKHFCLSW